MAETFRVSLQGLAELARLQLFGAQMPQIEMRAINRALDKTNTFASRSVAEDVGLTRRAIDRAIEEKRATLADPTAQLRVGGYRDARGRFYRGGRIPLIDLSAMGPEPSRGKGAGVSYRLRGGRGRRQDAFIATMPSGHRGVFIRSRLRLSGKRAHGAWGPNLPIQELFGPSPSRVFASKFVAAAVALGEQTLADELNRQMDVALGGRSVVPQAAA